jgi:hypothetical protein
MVQTIAAVVARLGAANHNPHFSPLLESATSALSLVYRKYINTTVMREQERLAIAVALAPSVVRMLEAVEKGWDTAQGDPEQKRLGSVIVRTCEGFGRQLISKAKPGTAETKLEEAWEAGDRQQFLQQLKIWQTVVSQPPFPKK